MGAVRVAISAFIALLPTFIMGAYREKRYLYIGLGLPVFLAFGAFSMSSAVVFSAKNRGGISEDRGLESSRLAEARKEIAVEEAKRTALGAPRPVAIVGKAMRGLEQGPQMEVERRL